jgi:acetyl-CoA acetyltransferase
MRDVAIVGAGMTHFGKYLDRGLKDLAAEAVGGALAAAGIEGSALQVAVVGNAAAGLVTGQEMIRAQVVLREMGIGGIPMVNTENACASSSTALHIAWLYVASGMYDVALALGVEKLYHQDKQRSFDAIGAALDVEDVQRLVAEMHADQEGKAAEEGSGAGQSRTVFMDIYASMARDHMRRYGTTKEQFAAVAAKNATHGSLNPKAQYREAKTVEDVLASPEVAAPLTRLMCAPIGDGAAALVLASADYGERLHLQGGTAPRPVRVAASVIRTGRDRAPDEPDPVTEAARIAFEQAGLGPEDIDVAEVHDATAPAELMIMEEVGLCAPGESGKLVEQGATRIGGKIPINTSGGLIARGHPVGATGAAQIVELTEQLRGRCGKRQVEGARVALAENAGGAVRADPAAIAVHILTT